MKLEFSHKFSKITLNVKSDSNPCRGSRVPCARGRTDGRTDRQDVNLIVAFRDFWNAPKKTKLSTKERIQDSISFFTLSVQNRGVLVTGHTLCVWLGGCARILGDVQLHALPVIFPRNLVCM